jgi:16S rRNA processing protein RimM
VLTHRSSGQRKVVSLGHISGAHGVKGWVRIYSLAEPREAIFEYQPWLLGEQLESVRILEGKKHGKHLIARLEKIEDRDQAQGLVGSQIAVYRDQLPELPADEYYWTDLLELDVFMNDGSRLGSISKMLATGAHDVMIVSADGDEVLIPFVPGRFVKKVDLEQGRIEVDWELGYQ